MRVDSDSVYKPILVSSAQVKVFAKKHRAKVVDTYVEQLEELFLLRNPRFRFDKNYQNHFEKFLRSHLDSKKQIHGKWFYFPWLNAVVHYLIEKEHLELRTGRNRLLINKAEQESYYNSRIGILGLSVGSHVALTIAMTGGGKYMKIADPDTISGSNLNRIRTGVPNVGIKKAVAVARQIYEMNPYAHLDVYPEGLTERNIHQFFSVKDKLDLLVEEMDNPFLKIKVRHIAKKQQIPVIMAADNADGIIVDVERFDLTPKRVILHGLLGNMTAEDFKNIPPKELPRVMARIAGANLSTLRMIESVKEVGKTLYSWPQLGNAATLCGSVLTYLARAIITGRKIGSKRIALNIADFFEKPSRSDMKKRDKMLREMGVYTK